jgi:DoxX-like protein
MLDLSRAMPRATIEHDLQCQTGGTHERHSVGRTQCAGRRTRPIISPLAGCYSHTRDLLWLVVRLTAGGMLLVHGIMKVMPMAENGFTATIAAFATGSMARRGIEPAIYAAYAVFFLETVGAVMIILGLFTRLGGSCRGVRDHHVGRPLARRLCRWARWLGVPAVLASSCLLSRYAAAARIRSIVSSDGSCSASHRPPLDPNGGVAH